MEWNDEDIRMYRNCVQVSHIAENDLDVKYTPALSIPTSVKLLRTRPGKKCFGQNPTSRTLGWEL